MMKAIVSFLCVGEPVPMYETPDTPGEAVARLFMELLSYSGAEFTRRSPTSAEGGWWMWFSLSGKSYEVFVNSEGLGQPVRDYWIASFGTTGGGILSILKRRRDDLECVIEIVRDLIHSNDRFTDIRWWDQRTFYDEVSKPGTHLGKIE